MFIHVHDSRHLFPAPSNHRPDQLLAAGVRSHCLEQLKGTQSHQSSVLYDFQAAIPMKSMRKCKRAGMIIKNRRKAGGKHKVRDEGERARTTRGAVVCMTSIFLVSISFLPYHTVSGATTLISSSKHSRRRPRCTKVNSVVF